MEDVNISKYRASVVREGSKPASPGFVVSEGQSPTDPAGTGQNHLPVTIAAASTGLSITESQILSGAGTVSQYIRGDGSLADFPESSGGGSSVSYYLNGSVNQGTIGGVAYRELSKIPVLGAGTDFSINANGYIASFITDAGDPSLLEIPGGNWNFETYFSASSGGGSPTFYVELYKVSGTTATLIASNSGSPELIAFGTTLTSYFSTLAVPTTTLALTDRLAVRYYVTHSGRTITLHTEDNHLCQIITTFTTGLTALNGLTAQVQNFAVGTSGTDFAISSATATHTFNLPTASATNRGALSSADWSTFNAKQNALTLTTTGSSGAATLVGSTLNIPIYSPDLSGYVPTSRTITINGTTQDLSANRTFNVGTVTSVGLSSATSGVTIGSTPVTGSGTITLAIATASGSQNGLLSSTDWTTFNSKQNALTNPVTGSGTTNYLPKFTGASTIGNSQVFDNGTGVGIGTIIPSVKLHVQDTSSQNPSLLILDGSNTGRGLEIKLSADGLGANGSAVIYNTRVGAPYGEHIWQQAGTQRMRLDNNGNLGLGVTPSAWSSAYKAIQFGQRGSVYSHTSVSATNLADNVFDDGVAKYIVNGVAGRYQMSAGLHQWFNAPSGTAGAAVSFTQAMTLTSGGNLLVGTTTDNGARLQVSGTGGIRINATTGSAAPGAIALSIRDSGNPVFGFDFNLEGVATGDLYLMRTNSGVQSTVLQIARATGAATFSSSVRSLDQNAFQLFQSVNTTDTKLWAIQNLVSSGQFRIRAVNDAETDGQNALVISRSGTSITNVSFPNGNVGIGTASPTWKLQVETTDVTAAMFRSNSSATILGIDNSAADGDPQLKFYINDIGTFTLGVDDSDGDKFKIGTSDLTTNTRLTIDASGNVGIGTASPNSRLHIAGDFRTVLTSGVGGDTLIAAISGVSNGYIINVDTSNNITHTWNTGANAAALRITPSGNVLIGSTTDNGSKLQVNGTIRSNDTYGFAIGSIASYRRIQYGSDNATSFTLLTDGNAYAGLYALSANFSTTIKTGNPTGSTSDNWLLGRALVSGSSTPDRWIRVQIGNLYYDILSRYIGSV